MRLRGLRVLARIIVRAHLASLAENDARRDGDGYGDAPGGLEAPGVNLPRKEGGHGR